MTYYFRHDGQVGSALLAALGVQAMKIFCRCQSRYLWAGAWARKTPNVGMWISGEVIIAQALLTRMGAASAQSVIVANHDGAVEEALRHYAEFDVMQLGAART
jgi:hypothetical protein